MEPSTGDGLLYDAITGKGAGIANLLGDVETKASDGLIFGTRDAM